MVTVTLLTGLSPTSPASAQEDPDGLLPEGDWSSAQAQFMRDLVAETEEELPRFSNNGVLDRAMLEDMGFRRFIATAPGSYDHWTNEDWIDDEHILNPEYPESLVFRNTGAGGWVLEAAMYYVPREYSLDNIPGDVSWLPGWHNHPELGISTPMMHVWITDNRCGHRFAGIGVLGLNCNVYGDPDGHDPGSDGPPGYPFGQDVHSELNGSVAVDVALGAGGQVDFPIGGEGVCKPTDELAVISGTVSESHDGHAEITAIEAGAVNADVVVADDGAICTRVGLDVTEGEMQADDEGGTLSLFDVAADVEIFGTGVFEQHIPAGCSLALDVGELSGTIAGDGPPSAVELSASGVSVAEAPASCGAYGHLLDVGFGLPSTDAEVALDLTFEWAGEDHEH